MERLSMGREDFLEAVLLLESELNRDVKSIDIAKFLKVSKPAVSRQLADLIEKGYALKLTHGIVKLTESGMKIAQKVLEKHHAIYDFLLKLGVSKEVANKDCCLIEHAISEETFLKIKEFNKSH